MKLRISILIFTLVFGLDFYAQQKEACEAYSPYGINKLTTSLGIVGGWQQGNFGFGEVGIGYGTVERGRHGTFFRAVSISMELSPSIDTKGYSLSGWFGSSFLPITMGLSTIYFRQFDNQGFSLRPMLGINLTYVFLTYAYNIKLDNDKITKRNSNMISLRFFLPAIKTNVSVY